MGVVFVVLYGWFELVGLVVSLRLLVSFVAIVAVFAYFTNPFVRFSLIRDPARIVIQDEKSLEFEKVGKIELEGSKLWQRLAYVKSGWHIP